MANLKRLYAYDLSHKWHGAESDVESFFKDKKTNEEVLKRANSEK